MEKQISKGEITTFSRDDLEKANRMLTLLGKHQDLTFITKDTTSIEPSPLTIVTSPVQNLQLTAETQNNNDIQEEEPRGFQKSSASSLPVQQSLSLEPYVIIKWSESKRFSEDEQLTFTEADLKFKEVEKIERAERVEQGRFGGYNKTCGTIYYLNSPADTEYSTHEFRYDIGDYDERSSGLLNHIKRFWTHVEKQISKGEITTFSRDDLEKANRISACYEPYTTNWYISNRNKDSFNLRANSVYGTDRINAYKIIEETLNLRDVQIRDNQVKDGRETYVLNRQQTLLAQAKQERIRNAFSDWIWEDPVRREQLCRLYNDTFNSERTRTYDGSHLMFIGMNSEKTLRQSQKNGVARILYGGNSLLAHVVGAGKTYTMIAAAMESKRLGLSHKSMVVVPNHLIEQFAADWMHLYPNANILVASKKDFEPKNRKKFCARIATGDYDGIIIGQSQFELIPVSQEYQQDEITLQIDELEEMMSASKKDRSENGRFTVKQLELARKRLASRLERLHDQSKKEDVITFEELGVDRLFVDEADTYKNLYIATKMHNVSGISTSEAKRASDLYLKCRYLNGLFGEKRVVFATGTPISNSMTELFVMQKYLQPTELDRLGLKHFDAWASTFGETVTAMELAPEGKGYRTKTRFARFYNIPELMSSFRKVADIQTADMLKLPVPKASFHTVAVKPSKMQQNMVDGLARRAEIVRAGGVDSSEDNMLKITNDGRKLALDQRLMNPLLPDFEGSKVNACVNNVFNIWKETEESRSTQLIFSDISTPTKDGSFNVYDDIKKKLVTLGIPENEIAFIHSADSDIKKKELFAQVRSGRVRILLGSTQKLGAGTNIQDKLIALHDLDCPWRPRDLEQRAGRIIRQGNKNPEVNIYRYVTEGTFDSYMFQLLESKQRL